MAPEPDLAPDLRAFIEAQQPGTPYSVLAGLLRQRFGADRAVDADTLRGWWQATHPRRASWIARDPEVLTAILDVAGRLNGDEIMAMLAARFAPARLPSRSALYRLLSEQRRRDAVARQAPTTT